MNKQLIIYVCLALAAIFLVLVLVRPFGRRQPDASKASMNSYGGPTLQDRQKAIEAEQARNGTAPKQSADFGGSTSGDSSAPAAPASPAPAGGGS
jgi:hypothetical protein